MGERFKEKGSGGKGGMERNRDGGKRMYEGLKKK